jgi:UDP-N-acetylmuramoyl-tripeptide--D-alanyl-D-alanine ligase
MKINLSDIFNLTDSVIYNPDSYKSVSNISIDSRTIKKNSLYVAIKGDKLDGHNFINVAILNGASSVLISENELNKFKNLNCTVITVPDTTTAYGELANIFRNKFKGKVISITGSNGKTTTKEILATILAEKFQTEKTEANNNNHIGIPKTILATKDKTEILILEHGTNHFNEIEYTANIAEPDYALITNIGDSHLEYLINKAGVYKEKSFLFNAALKNDGIIFVNNDDSFLKSETRKIKNKITFGFNGKPDVKGKIVGFTDDGRTKLSIKNSKKEFVLELPLFGISNAKNFLAAITVALNLGLTNKQIKTGVNKVQQVKGRLYI